MRSIAIVALFPLLLLSSSPARAHAYLDHASPRVGATVASSPGQVVLYFSQKLEPKFSKAEVRNAAGARVDQGSSVSGSMITVGVQGLAAGTYRVTWKVLSVDTHTTQGSFSFSFRVGK
jgi:methionine-rich copper-binding protein CopC